MAATPRNGVADLSLEDDDSIKKMSEVAKFARQNNIPGYRPNGHHPAPKPQKQRSENEGEMEKVSAQIEIEKQRAGLIKEQTANEKLQALFTKAVFLETIEA